MTDRRGGDEGSGVWPMFLVWSVGGFATLGALAELGVVALVPALLGGALAGLVCLTVGVVGQRVRDSLTR